MPKGELVSLAIADFSFEACIKSVRVVGRPVKRAVRKSGVSKTVTPHTFRHPMAAPILHNRADR
jgi:site-specific recombinase XerC